ncbi:lysine exporter LysO family protein [Anaerovoracaceae bacterium SGI.195]
MVDLAIYLACTVSGAYLGSRLTGYRERLSWLDKLLTSSILFMISAMGIRMGANDEVVSRLGDIAFYSVAITLVTMVFSVAGSYFVRKALGFDSKGLLHGRTVRVAQKYEDTIDEEVAKEENMLPIMTIYVVIDVLVSGGIGYSATKYLSIDSGRLGDFMGVTVFVAICLMLFVVGMTMGLDGSLGRHIRAMGFRIVIFPMVSIVASLLGSAISYLFMPVSFVEALAIGGGMAWPSLTSVMIFQHGMIFASAISYLHNLLRQIFSFIFIPLVAKKVGYIETFSMPAAASMDVCIAAVEKSTRTDIAVMSFVSGATISLVVPILLEFLLSM